ncbi:MAG: DMT family transporter, partial [Myxococcota bacterium]
MRRTEDDKGKDAFEPAFAAHDRACHPPKPPAHGPVFTVYAALVAVQILFGIWPIAGALALDEVSPPALIGFRTLVGGPLLFLLLSSHQRWPSRRDLLTLAALSMLGIVGNQLMYAEGLKRAGPINAVILVVIVPASTLLIGVLLGRERASVRRIAGIILTMWGVLVLVRAERFDLS